MQKGVGKPTGGMRSDESTEQQALVLCYLRLCGSHRSRYSWLQLLSAAWLPKCPHCVCVPVCVSVCAGDDCPLLDVDADRKKKKKEKKPTHIHCQIFLGQKCLLGFNGAGCPTQAEGGLLLSVITAAFTDGTGK